MIYMLRYNIDSFFFTNVDLSSDVKAAIRCGIDHE